MSCIPRGMYKQRGNFNKEHTMENEQQQQELQEHHKQAIMKAFDVAVRNSNENAIQFGVILGEILVILGIAKSE